MLLPLFIYSIAIAVKTPPTPVHVINSVYLHPTQSVVGFKEVQRKKEKIQNFKTDDERQKYFRKNVVPVVRGPDGTLYMVDHHHFALAAYQAGHTEVYYTIIADLSTDSEKKFWKKVQKHNLAYLKKNGKDIAVSDLPKYIWLLENDPFRSLAGVARNAGGFLNKKKRFAEFEWADHFRTRIDPGIVENNFPLAVQLAVMLAKQKEAKKLPGYIGEGTCHGFYYR